MKILLAALFFVSIAAEDDGAAFEVKWTKEDVLNCKKGQGVYTEHCDALKADEVVKVMDVDNCVGWLKATTPKDTKYDFKNLCQKFRRGCVDMKEKKEAKELPAADMTVWCAEAFKRHYSVYAQDVSDDRYTPKAPGKETKPAEKPGKETKPAEKPDKETKPAKKPE